MILIAYPNPEPLPKELKGTFESYKASVLRQINDGMGGFLPTLKNLDIDGSIWSYWAQGYPTIVCAHKFREYTMSGYYQNYMI